MVSECQQFVQQMYFCENMMQNDHLLMQMADGVAYMGLASALWQLDGRTMTKE